MLAAPLGLAAREGAAVLRGDDDGVARDPPRLFGSYAQGFGARRPPSAFERNAEIRMVARGL